DPHMFRHALFAASTLAALAPAAHADMAYGAPDVVAARAEPHRDRLYLGVGFVGTTMIDRKATLGDGMSIALGVNLSRNVAPELGVLGTAGPWSSGGSDAFALGAVTLDAKVRFLRGTVEPYAQVGVGEYGNGVVEDGSMSRIALGPG